MEKHRHRKWVFRGQADAAWELKTSLFRLFEDTEPIITSHKGGPHRFARDMHEGLLIESFQANAHLYISHLPDPGDRIGWLAIMQHHGAPTRLLDVTLSPHIATYFALESGVGDCCVFAVNHAKLSKIDDKHFAMKDYRDQVFKNLKGKDAFIGAWRPGQGSERQMTQQGLFLVPSNNYESFSRILGNYGAGGKACIKYVIAKKLRYSGLKRLRQMNITAATLFPGLDGFCRSLRLQVLETTKSLRRV